MTPVTTLNTHDLRDFFLLTPRIMSDYRPRFTPSAMLYVYSNTRDNDESSLAFAARHYGAGFTRTIGVCEGETEHGYAGFEHSRAHLMARGAPVRCIVPVKVEGNVNTYAEACVLAKRCSELGGDLEVVAAPFHIVRAFMTTVTALRNEGVRHRVYARVGEPLSWREEATHSQGALRATRAALLAEELARLERYRAPQFGSMMTPAEVIAYLDSRESIE